MNEQLAQALAAALNIPIAVDLVPGRMQKLQVFLQTCGRKPDQTAAFSFWAKAARLRPRTKEQWEAAFAAYQGRRVR